MGTGAADGAITVALAADEVEVDGAITVAPVADDVEVVGAITAVTAAGEACDALGGVLIGADVGNGCLIISSGCTGFLLGPVGGGTAAPKLETGAAHLALEGMAGLLLASRLCTTFCKVCTSTVSST